MFEPKTQEALNMAAEVLRAMSAFVQSPTENNEDEVIRLMRLYRQMSEKENR
jgi:hypothetical protein